MPLKETEDSSIFVGGLSGVFKGLKATHNKGVHNVKNLQALKDIKVRNEVTCLSWADKFENEILIGYNNQLVKLFDLNKNSFMYSEEKKVGEGPICGVFKLNGSLVTGVESGVIKVWSEKETVLETGGPLTRLRQHPNETHIIGTGGKENDLKLWDLESKKIIFQAKNVRHDELELRVPVWVVDLAFKTDSKQVAVATRYGHVRLYDPATPTRRPVCQVTAKDHSFTCIAAAPREHHVVVGCTTGNVYLIDLRGKGVLLNKYRGFMGSVRQVVCPASEPYVLSVSLDRHFRIHHLNTKKLLVKEYMQSRLSALLLKSDFTMEDVKDEVKEENETVNSDVEDEEYEQMFDQLEVIHEKPTTVDKTRKTKVTKKKTTTKENDSEEESKNLVSEIEGRKNNQNVTEKRKRPNVKSKTKKFRTQEPEVIVIN